MKFGACPLSDAAGLVLAHTLRAGKITLKKGHTLTATDLAALSAAGVAAVTGARLEPGDVGEDAAAGEIAHALAGEGVHVTAARTGRCNIEAAAKGLVLIDAPCIDALNVISETVTIATLPDKADAYTGQIAATVKIIPFAVEAAVMDRVRARMSRAVRLAPYRHLRTVLISTLASGLKTSVVESTEEITAARVNALGGSITARRRTAHESHAITTAVKEALSGGVEQILIAGASATTDREDAAPAGIVAAGGVIDHFGMPVDPGNLLVLARIGRVPVLVLPGCARSPKPNGADWVMQRIAAGIPVMASDIMAMGVGGLLVDTPVRPLPRAEAVKTETAKQGGRITPARPPVAAIVLAAGRSTRMGARNKLLMAANGQANGQPLIRRTVETVLAARLAQVIVVTGHQEAAVAQALAGLPVTIVHNPRYSEGLSTSLQAGLSAADATIAGALICLGDMPGLEPGHLERLTAGFDPAHGRAIGVPVHGGKRGNPVLWDRRFFADMHAIVGDVGARHLIGAHESLVYEVEFGDTAVLTDLDTPEQWSAYLGSMSGTDPAGA